MKNNILIVAAVLAIGCLVMVVISGRTVDQTRKELERERYKRMVAEEKIEAVNAKIKSLEGETTNAQNQTQSIQTVLEEEKNANDTLRKELEKMTKLKGVLEEQLKNALVKPASPQTGQ